MSTLREKFLVSKVRRTADHAAYAEIYDLYFDRIRRFLMFKLPRIEDADELTSEVFLRGWEYMSGSSVDSLNAFFFRIARNLVTDFYRRYKITEGIEKIEKMSNNVSIEREVADKIASAELMEALKELRDDWREVLVMRYLSEMDIGEIASAIDKSHNGVRVLLHRAKKALQDKMVTKL